MQKCTYLPVHNGYLILCERVMGCWISRYLQQLKSGLVVDFLRGHIDIEEVNRWSMMRFTMSVRVQVGRHGNVDDHGQHCLEL